MRRRFLALLHGTFSLTLGSFGDNFWHHILRLRLNEESASSLTNLVEVYIVLLPGFQKGRDIKASQGKEQGAVLAKKGQFASYKEKGTEFHSS
jgi:hypothetical protein